MGKKAKTFKSGFCGDITNDFTINLQGSYQFRCFSLEIIDNVPGVTLCLLFNLWIILSLRWREAILLQRCTSFLILPHVCLRPSQIECCQRDEHQWRLRIQSLKSRLKPRISDVHALVYSGWWVWTFQQLYLPYLLCLLEPYQHHMSGATRNPSPQ